MFTFTDVSATTSRRVIRPRTLERCGILLHETIGRNSLAWLQGGSAQAGFPASSDFLIDRFGSIFQITPPGWYAYHSGVARWREYQEPDKSINQGFVGIELENDPTIGQVDTSEQYIACGWLVRMLLMAHTIEVRNIVGHYQVALPVGRKSDPSTFNWALFTRELATSSKEAHSYVLRGELS